MADIVTLGLGGANHDFSAAVAVNGVVVSAIAEERLTREKYSVNVDLMSRDFSTVEELNHQNRSWTATLAARGQLDASIQYVLDAAGLSLADVDLLGHCCAPSVLPKVIADVPQLRINHHRSHAASSFLASPFERAAVITADGAGDRIRGTSQLEAISLFEGRGQSLDLIWHLGDPHSIGGLYEAATFLIGFRLLEEGKTMALASYGTPRLYERLRPHVRWHPDGKLTIGDEPVELRRVPDRVSKVKLLRDWCGLDERLSDQDKADLAYAAQQLIEEALLHVARWARERIGPDALCVAGGVGLNSVANYRLLREAGFDDIFIQPHAGDGGLAVGNTLLATELVAPGKLPRRPMTHAYLGRSYSDAEVATAIAGRGAGIVATAVADPAKQAARLIAEGKVIGWFQGGSEWGPRALGNRSILADPRRRESKTILDTRVKRREPFRPYAPAVLADRAGEFFDIDRPSPFMLLVAPVRPERQAEIPAVVHVDGTARLQTVDPVANPPFAALLREFAALTGVPIVLNTSFNVNKEPIVETPDDAIRTFLDSQLDALVVQNHVVTRP